MGHPLSRDTTELRVSNADGKFYVLMYLNPIDMEPWYSEDIETGCSAGALKAAIGGYYSSVFGTNPHVSKHCIDYNNSTIDCNAAADEIRDHMYTITVPRSIGIASTNQIMAVPIDTRSSLVVRLPEEV